MGGLKEIAILLQKSNTQREDYVLSAFRCGRKKILLATSTLLQVPHYKCQ